MPDIAVIDYGMGNLRSVAKALAHVAPARSIAVSADPAVIRAAGHVVLPGQSAMPDCIRSLDASGLREVVLEVVRTRPFLGICLGLQMLFESSDEGPTPGLGVLPGRVVRFRDEAMTLPSASAWLARPRRRPTSFAETGASSSAQTIAWMLTLSPIVVLETWRIPWWCVGHRGFGSVSHS